MISKSADEEGPIIDRPKSTVEALINRIQIAIMRHLPNRGKTEVNGKGKKNVGLEPRSHWQEECGDLS